MPGGFTSRRKIINLQDQISSAESACRCLISRIVHQHGRVPICLKRIFTLRAGATLFPCAWHQRLSSSRGDGQARLLKCGRAFFWTQLEDQLWTGQSESCDPENTSLRPIFLFMPDQCRHMERVTRIQMPRLAFYC